MKKMLYLVDGNITKDTGFSQRIMRQMDIWKEIPNLEIDIFNSLSYRDCLSNTKLKSKTKKIYSSDIVGKIHISLDLPLSFFKYAPDIFYKAKARKVKRIININNYNLIYCENLRAAYVGYLALKDNDKIKLVLDYHGVVPEEFRDFTCRNMGKMNYDYLKKMESTVIKNVDEIICVSNEFKDYIIKNFNYDKENIYVIPSCVPINYLNYNPDIRREIRKNLNIDNKKVIVYAGSVVAYQCVNEMISLFKNIVDIDRNYFFLFLVANNSIDFIKQKFKQNLIDEESFLVATVPHKNIFDFYSASDYGIVIRNNSLVNRVASPTKILEYLSTGLPLIITDNVGDFPNLDVEKVVIEYSDIKENSLNVSKLLESLNVKSTRINNFKICETYLMENYVWENQLLKYQNIIFS